MVCSTSPKMADEDFDRAIALSLQDLEDKHQSSTSLQGTGQGNQRWNSQELAFFTSAPLPTTRNNNNNTAAPAPAPPIPYLPSPLREDQNRIQQEQRDALFARELAKKEKEEEEQKLQQQQQQQQAKRKQENSPARNSRDEKPTSSSNRQSNSSGCKGCGKSIQGKYLVIREDEKYHPNCFCCAGCGQPLESRYITKDENSENMEYYHERCYGELFTPKCDVCAKKLVGEYRTHGFFRGLQNYCSTHEGQTKQCFSCAMKEPTTDPYPELPDGRVICWKCIDTIVVDSVEAGPLYQEAVHFMENVLGLPIPPNMRDVPVLAVDLGSLNEQNNLKATTCSSAHPNCPSDSNRFGNAGTFSGSVTRGLTLTTVSQVRYVSSENLLWGDFFRNSRDQHQLPNQRNGTNLQFPTVRLERTCSVTAVLVLCGLPRDLTTSILAHEAMHVWCKLRESNGKPSPLLDLPSQVEEGLCQYVAYRYLEYIQERNESKPSASTSSSSSSSSSSSRTGEANGSKTQSWQEKLIPYFKYQIECDPSSVYGDGFRLAAGCCSTLSFEYALEYVIQNHNFPEI